MADHPDAATPLDPDEAAGLIPSHIGTQTALNEWEQTNILEGQRWALRRRSRIDPLTEGFVRETSSVETRSLHDTFALARGQRYCTSRRTM